MPPAPILASLTKALEPVASIVMSDLMDCELEEQVSVLRLQDHMQSPSPGQRLLTRLQPLSPTERRETHFSFPASPRTPSPPAPCSPAPEHAFNQDFDLCCRGVLLGNEEKALDLRELTEVLEGMHMVRGDTTIGRELVGRFWEVMIRPGAGRIPVEDVRKALKSILGIVSEPSPIWSSILRSFRSFASSRLRYLNLEASTIVSSLPLNSPNKENSMLGQSPGGTPKSGKPQLPLGRDPVALMRDRPSLSPVRLPTLRKPLATVKINLTPTKSDILKLYRGDNLKEAVTVFSCKHKLRPSDSTKLLQALEAQLRKQTSLPYC
jgi:hypothetical protein